MQAIQSTKARVNRLLFGISETEASFERRGFQPAARAKQDVFERVGRTFISGYAAALEGASLADLAAHLDQQTEAGWRGFAYEGAAMGLALIDFIWTPTRSENGKFREFVWGVGNRHKYMLHVGYGWAVARLPWVRARIAHAGGSGDPLLHWLIVDGYGFHEGYFHWKSAIESMRRPARLSDYAGRAFDQGLGRSLWFFNGGDVERTAACVERFDAARRSDLWSGLGLAITYAGSASAEEVLEIRRMAGEFAPDLAQGSAFASKARELAGNLTPETERTAGILCGMPAREAAAITDTALEKARQIRDGLDLYERWRMEIRSTLQRAHTFAA